MKLTANSMHYEHPSDDGHTYVVDAVYDPEFGWSASVSMRTDGATTPEEAVKRLRLPVEAFLRALKEVET